MEFYLVSLLMTDQFSTVNSEFYMVKLLLPEGKRKQKHETLMLNAKWHHIFINKEMLFDEKATKCYLNEFDLYCAFNLQSK